MAQLRLGDASPVTPPSDKPLREGGWFRQLWRWASWVTQILTTDLFEMGETTVDFTSTPSASASVVIDGQDYIEEGSLVEAWIEAKATSDHTEAQHAAEPLRVVAGTIVPGTGFTIYVYNDGGTTSGTWTVAWRWH